MTVGVTEFEDVGKLTFVGLDVVVVLELTFEDLGVVGVAFFFLDFFFLGVDVPLIAISRLPKMSSIWLRSSRIDESKVGFLFGVFWVDDGGV